MIFMEEMCQGEGRMAQMVHKDCISIQNEMSHSHTMSYV